MQLKKCPNLFADKIFDDARWEGLRDDRDVAVEKRDVTGAVSASPSVVHLFERDAVLNVTANSEGCHWRRHV